MKYFKRSVMILGAILLAGCASPYHQYRVTEATAHDMLSLQDVNNWLYGKWLDPHTLEITLFYNVDGGWLLSKPSLRADYAKGLIKLRFDVIADKSMDTNKAIPLCMDTEKLTFVLHRMSHQTYRVQVIPTVVGKVQAEKPKLLRIRQ